MDDLISRQSAIDAFNTMTADGDKAEWCVWVIEQLPSAQERKTGQWIYLLEEATYQCSECRMIERSGGYYCYCPNCGARMR